MSDRIFNFSAGPAVLPEVVLERARDELLNFEECGMSVMELSHRSKTFDEILNRAEFGLREVFDIPKDYVVLFLQGGATLQFSMIPMNLYLKGKPVDVVNTGAWTQKAIVEINKVGKSRLAASTEDEHFTCLPNLSDLDFNPEASYVHMASNNTIFGTQWGAFPDTGDVPLVVDMSSDILSKAVDVSKFGLVFAGAQKNIGPAGVTIVIMRPDLADRVPDNLPIMLDYRTHIKKRSLYNTPPTYGIYMISLVMAWIKGEGGLEVIEKRNDQKAALLYEAIDSSDFYTCPITNNADRSKMNVVFRFSQTNEALEKTFLSEAQANGLENLKGHRSTGGFRASIYNAQSLAGVQALVKFMNEFEQKYA